MKRVLRLSLIVPALLMGACGGGESGSSSAAEEIGVRLTAPAGWATSDDGLVVARDEVDLDADFPSGPRVRVERGGGSVTQFANLDQGSAETDIGLEADVLDGPQRTSVKGRDALSITLREAEDSSPPIVRRYLVATSRSGDTVMFVLEAPPAEFEANRTRLQAIPGWA